MKWKVALLQEQLKYTYSHPIIHFDQAIMGAKMIMKDLQAIKVGIVDNLNLDVECESSDDFSS